MKDKIGDCKIKRNGEIHAYGRMPNSIETGWYLFGWLYDGATIEQFRQLRIEAITARDTEQMVICDHTLNGRQSAIRQCVRIIVENRSK